MAVGDSDIPTFENVDPNDPEEFALPAFVGMSDDAPMVLPVSYWRKVCKRLWDLGFRQAEEPTIKWRMQARDPANPMPMMAGQWVPIDEPDDHSKAAEVLDRMRPEAFDALVDEMAKRRPTDPTIRKMQEGK